MGWRSLQPILQSAKESLFVHSLAAHTARKHELPHDIPGTLWMLSAQPNNIHKQPSISYQRHLKIYCNGFSNSNTQCEILDGGFQTSPTGHTLLLKFCRFFTVIERLRASHHILGKIKESKSLKQHCLISFRKHPEYFIRHWTFLPEVSLVYTTKQPFL